MENAVDILSGVKHPEINNSLVDLGMIGEIRETEEVISVELKLPFIEIPIRPMLEESIRNALSGRGNVDIIPTIMSDEERIRFLELARMNWAL